MKCKVRRKLRQLNELWQLKAAGIIQKSIYRKQQKKFFLKFRLFCTEHVCPKPHHTSSFRGNSEHSRDTPLKPCPPKIRHPKVTHW